jgi:hypothetical protein
MHVGTMRIDADLNGLNRQIAKAPRLVLSYQGCISLQSHAEHQLASMLDDLEDIFSHKDLSAAQRQDKHAVISHVLQQVLDLSGRHFAMVAMVQITMHTSFVATVSQIELYV